MICLRILVFSEYFISVVYAREQFASMIVTMLSIITFLLEIVARDLKQVCCRSEQGNTHQ